MDLRVNAYRPRHAKRPDPSELPAIFRGLADMIVIVDSPDDSK